MTITAGTRLGPYEVIAPIGAGGMGEVFKARDTRLERSVAIKVLPAEFANDAQLRLRFEREAKTISQLSHPNICTLYDVGDGYLVMELLEGETLADRISRGSVPLDQVVRIGSEVANALDRAHKAGVIHRDLKPSNVMLTKSGAKLLDFGLAKPEAAVLGPHSLAGETVAKPITQEGTFVGTFQYMAPEQLEGGTVDARTDIFALGALLYEMVTAKHAFDGKSKASVIAAILGADPQPITTWQPASPPALDRLIRTCLAKDPDERWQSARDVAIELRSISEKSFEVAPRRSATAWMPWSITAALAVATIVLGALLSLRVAEAQHPHILRASINPPPGATFDFTYTGAPPAISPDGTMVVFGAVSNGERHLWLRELRGDEARVVPDTLSAGYPFWSPDSRRIGFFADDKLKKIEIGSSTAVAVCDAPGARGGTWNSSGVIVFGSRVGTIFRTTENGGAAVPVTSLGSDDVSHRWPVFLPDGEHFLFTADVPVGAGPQICAGSIRGGLRRTILNAASQAAVLHDTILYVQKQVLTAQRFDAKELRVVGAPTLLPEQHIVAFGPQVRSLFSVSNDGTLVYESGVADRNQLVWFTHDGREIGAVGAPGEFGAAAIAPDSQRIVVTDFSTSPRSLWLTDPARGVKSRLMTPANFAPVWSPDGTRIACAAVASSARESHAGGGRDLHMVDLRTGADELLVRNANAVAPSSWSRDGQYLFVSVRSMRDTGTDLFYYSFRDRQLHPYLVTREDEMNAQISPDGKWVAFQSTDSGHWEIYIAPFPATGARWQISTNGGIIPQWSSDGKELLFADSQLNEISVPMTFNSVPVPGQPHRLFASQTLGTSVPVAVAPDGKFLVWRSEGGTAQQSLTVVNHLDAEIADAEHR